jgi:DNA-binding NtrC family response regulator
LEFSGADRGYFVRKENGDELIFYDSLGKIEVQPEVSLSSIRTVFDTGNPVCMIENADGQSIPQTASILALNLKTIMCSPVNLKIADAVKAQGVLYVDSQFASRPFDRQDLDFFSILTKYASSVWNHLDLVYHLENDFKLLHDEVRSKFDYHKIVGQCDAMKQVYQVLEMLRETKLDVLILGETGTGKELIAKAIHYASDRSDKLLKELNCAALPEGLVEAELFGVERNVATEVDRRLGKLEQANGGTLFLDEIGDMPIRVQNRLLRFLEERKFRRIGGRDEVKSNVRVLAATNKDLEAEIKAGRFRDALRFRLDVVTIRLPLLKDRGNDLELLADFFLKEIVSEHKLPIKGFTAEAWRIMKEYEWPGNVRELKHRVQSAAFLARGYLIEATDLGIKKALDLQQMLSLDEQLNFMEKQLIETSLSRFPKDRKLAAENLGISVEELSKRITKRELE